MSSGIGGYRTSISSVSVAFQAQPLPNGGVHGDP